MPFHPENTVVWFEIPVTDLTAARTFYEALLQTKMKPNTDGPHAMVDFVAKDPASGVAGHLLVGKPAAPGTGAVIHLALVGTVEDAMMRCTAAGGKVTSPVITIHPGRFAYALDPDGNALGLFQPAQP